MSVSELIMLNCTGRDCFPPSPSKGATGPDAVLADWPFSQTYVDNAPRPEFTTEIARAIDTVIRRYWNMLVKFVPLSGFKSPKNGKITILNLGCGIAYDAIPTRAYFEGNKTYSESSGTKVQYYGVDIDAGAIDKDIIVYGQTPGYHFIKGDARYLDGMPELPAKVDVVVFRHPGPFLEEKERVIWTDIFKAAIKKVKLGGRIIFSCTHKTEKQELLKILKGIKGYEIVLVKKNPFSVTVFSEIFDGEYGPDKWVVIAKRTKPWFPSF